MKSTNFFNLFWLTTFIHIASIFMDADILGYISKPFLMIFLGLAFFSTLKEDNKPVMQYKLVFVALLFSWFGDIFLMIPTDLPAWFMLGVFSFMVAQLAYVFIYIALRTKANPALKHQLLKLGLTLSILIYMVGLWKKLQPVLADMLIPVTIYTIAILSMALAAIFRLKRTNITSYIYVLVGALIFIASDSMIAIDKFLFQIDGERFLIMSTYILAQYLIIKGLLAHIKAF